MPQVGLELLIQSDRAVQGGRQVQAAFDGIYGSAARITTAQTNWNKALRDSFQASQGTVQVARGLLQTGDAFSKLNLQAGLFNASMTLMEVGRTAKDFRELGEGVGGVSGKWGLLSAAWKLNPIGIVATGIGLAATAMSVFSSNTSKAAESWDKLGEAMRRAKIGELSGALLGIGSTGGAQTQKDAVRAQIEALLGSTSGGQISINEFRSKSTMSTEDIGRYLASIEHPAGLAYMNPSGPGALGLFSPGAAGSMGPYLDERAMLTRGQQIGLLQYQYSGIGANQRAYEATLPGLYQFGRARPGINEPADFPFRDNSVGPSTRYPERDRLEMIEESYRKQLEYVHAMESAFAGIGSQLGGIAADFLFAGQSLQQGLANFIKGTASQGLQRAGGALLGAVGKTFAQGQADSGGGFIGPMP